MLSLPKRNKNSAARLVLPAWHPNFRDYEKLPDVKVVRTAFFVNAVAIVAVLSLAIYFSVHEWQLHVIRLQVNEWQQQIDQKKRPSAEAVALFKKFQAEEVKGGEVDAFIKTRPIVSDILLRLAETLPENIAFDEFDLRANGVALRMTVRGSPEAAAGYATAYLDQLRADEHLTAFDRNKFQFTNQARDAGTNRLKVEFFLEFVPDFGGKRS